MLQGAKAFKGLSISYHQWIVRRMGPTEGLRVGSGGQV